MLTSNQALIDDYAAFQRLTPVHHLVLDYLSRYKPTTYILLSKYHYNKIIPEIYETITINLSTFQGLATSTPERTIKALRNTKTILLDSTSADIAKRVLRGQLPFPKTYKELFPNVKTVEFLKESFITKESITPIGNMMRSENIHIENTLWMQVRFPIQSLTFHLIGINTEELGTGSGREEEEALIFRLKCCLQAFQPHHLILQYDDYTSSNLLDELKEPISFSSSNNKMREVDIKLINISTKSTRNI
ncbi:uncharacterized protein L201_001486 [Kwoniella dendrophila CBS 6074]|uniref:Uncharacterized protein n=1 Tax=Kwoniella dendrophila CBS 6074 TaxID=1295534 RepID=A0AAX4JMJ5_9TREE